MGQAKTARVRYHHGDLRAALLAGAEQELAENGIEGFSMRAVAARAGVSHAAPKRHFADVAALLTALTAVSFERFAARMNAVPERTDAAAQLIEVAKAYVEYAQDYPALFELQFFSNVPDRDDPGIARHADVSFALMAELAARGAGAAPDEPKKTRLARARMIWAFTHGVASLQARSTGGSAQEVQTLLSTGLPRLLRDAPRA